MKAVLIAAAVVLLVGFAAKSHLAGRNANAVEGSQMVSEEIPPVDIPSNMVQSDEIGPDFKLVLLALLPHGFETTEMQLDAGEYRFIIGNRTGLKEVNVRIEREGQEQLAAATLGGRPRDFKQRLKLTPGNYLISAADNPDWVCRILVRP